MHQKQILPRVRSRSVLRIADKKSAKITLYICIITLNPSMTTMAAKTETKTTRTEKELKPENKVWTRIFASPFCLAAGEYGEGSIISPATLVRGYIHRSTPTGSTLPSTALGVAGFPQGRTSLKFSARNPPQNDAHPDRDRFRLNASWRRGSLTGRGRSLPILPMCASSA